MRLRCRPGMGGEPEFYGYRQEVVRHHHRDLGLAGGRRRLLPPRPAGEGQGASGRGGLSAKARHSGHGRTGRAEGCAGFRARPRHGAGVQDRHGENPRRRPDRQDLVRGRPGRESGRSLVPDRPAAVPGTARTGQGGKAARRGATRRRPARPRALWQADRLRASNRARATTSRRRRWMRSRARSPPTRPQIDTAQLNLAYADIRAPIDGRTGQRLVDLGNLVQTEPGNHLVTITQIKPIFVNFTIPQLRQPQPAQEPGEGTAHRLRLQCRRHLQARRRQDHAGRQPDRHGHGHAPAQGRSSTTPTSSCGRANSSTSGCSWRCATARSRCRSGAVMQGAQGNYAFVIKPDSTAERRHARGRGDRGRRRGDRQGHRASARRSWSTANIA